MNSIIYCVNNTTANVNVTVIDIDDICPLLGRREAVQNFTFDTVVVTYVSLETLNASMCPDTSTDPPPTSTSYSGFTNLIIVAGSSAGGSLLLIICCAVVLMVIKRHVDSAQKQKHAKKKW